MKQPVDGGPRRPGRQRRNAPLTELARRLDEAAEASGLTNQTIADALGFSVSNVSHWRTGKHDPDVATIQRFAELTGSSDYFLLTGRPDPETELAALRQARAQFRTAVLAGADPADAWECILDAPGLLTEAERQQLSSEGADLRRFLATADGVEWVALDPEARAVVADLLRLLAQRAPPPEAGSAETSG